MGQVRYAGIIIDRAHPSLDRVFHYEIPEKLVDKITIGTRVLVPFGLHNSTVEGYVVALEEQVDIPKERIKPILKALDDDAILSEKFIPLIQWMKEEYHCLTIEALRCFIPPGIRVNIKKKVEKVVYLNLDDDIDQTILSIEKRSRNMAEALRVLQDTDGLLMREIRERIGVSYESLRSMEKRGWIRIVEEEIYREPQSVPLENSPPPELTDEQRSAVAMLTEALRKEESKFFLLHGVTGSGKTEVYLRAVQQVLELGKQAIVLVPEISLTPQTVGRFKSRFGDQVAILHSRLSLGERYDEWRRIQNQEVSIVVGARSAVFAPLKKLGLIIIDEAHEDSYKSDAQPRYHAVGIAKKRCELERAVLVIGTATPSVEDLYWAEEGLYTLIRMKNRVNREALPSVEIVDMRQEIEKGNRSIFSQSLYLALEETLRCGQQAILLLNRRGYAQFVSCRSCGFVMKCRHCDVSLTYHADQRMLKCHYCGAEYPYPSLCPRCKSRYIKHFGAGTQRVEEELKKFFPKARTVRMDMDTTSRKGAHEKILRSFREREYDILLGTQMIAKGLDFPEVTLVGVIAADTSLNLPEYLSCEKTFQLITQVAGRAGRGMKGGKVIVQTYQPEHYAIVMAANHDCQGFYQKELKFRREFQYPPFSHIIRILLIGEKEKSVAERTNELAAWLKERINGNLLRNQGLIDLGAYPAPLTKINNQYRWHVLLRIRPEVLFKSSYHELIEECLAQFHSIEESIVIDFYPVSLL